MSDQPLISVIIPVYNVASYVEQTLRSVLDQTYPKLEIIVVDDGSSDDTGKIVDRYLTDPRIKYIQQENAGPAAARNRGVCQSGGDLIAFLDGDDLWLPEKLERQVKLFLRDPCLQISATNYSIISEDGSNTGRLQYSECPKDLIADPKSTLLCRGAISTCTVMMRRESFDSAGGFDESLRWAEDYDMWLKVVQNGGRLAFTMEPLTQVRSRPGSLMADACGSHRGLLAMYGKAWKRERTIRGRFLIFRSILRVRSNKASYEASRVMPERPLLAASKLIAAWVYQPRRLRVLSWGLALLVPNALGGCFIRERIHSSMKQKLWHGGR
ncbi:MAG: glycosyltransferase family 2 protein [Armatimonadota bacterium]